MNKRQRMSYTVIVEQDPPGNWHAYAPAVPGCFAGGRTRSEALRRYRAAIKLHLKALATAGEALPVERQPPAVQMVLPG